mgnify:CR=1 FL=1
MTEEGSAHKAKYTGCDEVAGGRKVFTAESVAEVRREVAFSNGRMTNKGARIVCTVMTTFLKRSSTPSRTSR